MSLGFYAIFELLRSGKIFRLKAAWFLLGLGLSCAALSASRPNFLWISAEDINARFGCYGDPHAITPHLDELATEGMRYTRAFTTAGVCAPCRSGIITGMYQTTLGTQHMRSRAKLPDYIRPFPAYLRQNGYYCSNNRKQDYQFNTPEDAWDESSGEAHWRNRPEEDQPFFAVFNFTGCHESGIANTEKYRDVTRDLTPEQRQDPYALTTYPPYYPETSLAREDWKRQYELITAMDAWVGDLIGQLKEDGLYENTIIFYWSDHGVGLPRAKRWLYDSGTHIPLIIRIPEGIRRDGQGIPGTVAEGLVSSIDFGPTVLNLAGVEIPGHVQGRPFLGADLSPPREYVYGARDRMDERYDIIRMVRDERYKYIRNYEPLKTYYQYMNTPEKGTLMRELRRLHEAGKLEPMAEYYFNATKPVEELYDTQADPNEVFNLADEPRYAGILARMRRAHLEWVKTTRDTGLLAEPILVEREKVIGHRYGILRQNDDPTLAVRVAETAVLASQGVEALASLKKAMRDRDGAVRYWGAIGVGNIGQPALSAKGEMTKALRDPSPVVRVAAARALCRLGKPAEALPVLVDVLRAGKQWERLHAAIVLDEIDRMANPVKETMRAALRPRKDLYAEGKYVVRVLNRAMNQLEGTRNEVP